MNANDQICKFIADMVYKSSGIFYSEKDFYRLDSRINLLKTMYQCESDESLLSLLNQSMSAEMKTQIIDICTNNETYFFRDEKPFAALKELYKQFLIDHPSRPFNIWSAASSTGQEPLSILMSLEEVGSLDNIRFKATDISTKALAKAKSGTYSNLDVQRGLPVTLLMKYFQDNPDGSWKVQDHLLNKINYSHFNLLDLNFGDEIYDVIFCRNVLIYQTSENKQMILEALFKALRPNGKLIMGAGESLIGSKVNLSQETIQNAMVFSKNADSSKKLAG